MAARQAINVGSPSPNYIAESGTRALILPGLYLAETGAGAAAAAAAIAPITATITGTVLVQASLAETLAPITGTITGTLALSASSNIFGGALPYWGAPGASAVLLPAGS